MLTLQQRYAHARIHGCEYFGRYLIVDFTSIDRLLEQDGYMLDKHVLQLFQRHALSFTIEYIFVNISRKDRKTVDR